MYSQCRHMTEGILPTFPVLKLSFSLFGGIVIKLTVYLLLSLLILLPRKSLAAGPQSYETVYACEGKTLTIACDPGYLISLIRANYGRFSIAICNDHGNTDWSVNCMSSKTLQVLHSKCTHKQNCSVLASTNMFGDPCPGTHKYLEAHYQCISAAQTSTTTTRPSPPWLITNLPNLWSTSIIPPTVSISPAGSGGGGGAAAAAAVITSATSSQTIGPTTARILSIHQMALPPTTNPKSSPPTSKLPASGSTSSSSSSNIHLAGARPPVPELDRSNQDSSRSNLNQFPSPHGVFQSSKGTSVSSSSSSSSSGSGNVANDRNTVSAIALNNETVTVVPSSLNQQTSRSDTRNDSDEEKALYNQESTQSTVLVNNNKNNNYDSTADSSYYCGPTTNRFLFWNITRVGEVNVQPCPGGAFGIAKWRCILQQIHIPQANNNLSTTDQQSSINNPSLMNQLQRHRAIWHPKTPDLTQCRSVWINNLEISVNQRDSSLISIANDLSQITSSKALYGGDMLVTTKIIQTMSEKMAYDIETFPDQKQREAIITELLNGVVKTGSNLLDISHEQTWLDLSFEDQMRVATSLLTGLEDNAFLLADSIIRERTVIQKVKNILLLIRVLDTRNIAGNELFPDSTMEQWPVSDDRIELPRGALVENSEGGLVRIVFVAFDRLETILKPSLNHLDVTFTKIQTQQNQSKDSMQQPNRILNSKVISASLGKGRHIQLSQPIRLVLRHLKVENVTNPVCVFWNYIDHSWSEDGCYLEHTNHTHTICVCNHLTNFAILMDTTQEMPTSFLSLLNNNMRILIYISIAICIIFIIVAILTLKLFNGIFIKSTRSSIYKNIYVCLFIIEILFLLGIKQSETSVLCGFTTAFLHCFVLSAIAWLFFEGFQLYLTLTADDAFLEVETSPKLIWYYLLSYGQSFTIVAISLTIDPATYTQNDFCVLMEPNTLFYTTFMAPLAILAMGANAYMIRSTYVLCRKSRTVLKNKEHTRLSNLRFDLRCSFLFLSVLAVDWIFAYIYLRKAKFQEDISLVYGYGFVIFNLLLGIYIFIFHCIQNEKIRHEYRKYIRQYKWLPKCLRCCKISISSSTSQHQHYGSVSSNKKNSITDGSVFPALPAVDEPNNFDSSVLQTEAYVGSKNDNDDTIDQGITTKLPSIVDHRTNILFERSDETLKGLNETSAINATIGDRISPTSSAGSTHLIFNSNTVPSDHQNVGQMAAASNELVIAQNVKNSGGQGKSEGFPKKLFSRLQDWNFHLSKPALYLPQSSAPTIESSDKFNTTTTATKNFNTYDDKYLNSRCRTGRQKQSSIKPEILSSASAIVDASMLPATASRQFPMNNLQNDEFFYWTEKTFGRSNRKQLNSGGDTKSTIGSNFYPSYQKTPRHYQSVEEAIDDDRISRSYHYRSDEDLRADSHLGYGLRSKHPKVVNHDRAAFSGSGGDGNVYRIQQQQQQQKQQNQSQLRFRRDRDGTDAMTLPTIPANNTACYYGHSPRRITAAAAAAAEEPVYEEILGYRGTDLHDDEDDYDDDDCDDRILKDDQYNRLKRIDSNGMDPLHRQPFHRYQMIEPNFDQSMKCNFKTAPVAPPPVTSRLNDSSFVWSQGQQQQQQQQQQQSQQPNQQQIVGRNLSAVLDGNNTVICYLEPLPK